MHFCYVQVNGNAEQAHRMYINAYPDTACPFVNIHKRLGGQSPFQNISYDKERPRGTRTVERKKSPATSTRKITTREHCSCCS